MQSPIMLRSTHELIVEALEINIQLIREVNILLNEKLAGKDREIAALIEIAQVKSVMITSEKEAKTSTSTPFPVTGRGAWRARAQMRSEGTVPTPRDSATSLEMRVKKEGGSV